LTRPISTHILRDDSEVFMYPSLRFRRSLVLLAAILSLLSHRAFAQDISPPIPQRFTLHSAVLNEDRTIWVRTPRGYQATGAYSVLYLMDGPAHINEIGSTIDFLVEHDRMPPLIVVGIANTDRTRDLTPSHSDQKNPDGTAALPTSGGGDRFLDFIQTEMIPEVQKRYRTSSCYRVFAGHSLGGLMAIHTLITRPDLFNAYIAVSPSLQWNDQKTLHQAQEFFAKRAQLGKTLFFSLGNEGNTENPMGQAFDHLRESLTAKAPKDFHWDSARYPDEDHGSTVLRAHYAGLRTVFAGWQVPAEPDNGLPGGGLVGVEKHYHDLSQQYGCPVAAPETLLNRLGYQLLQLKKTDEAIATFQRNVELYPGSANVYDSLGDGYEAAGKLDRAIQNVEKAVAVGTKIGDQNLDLYQAHLKRVVAAKAASDKAASPK
jgi:uncharacterized protein